MFNFQADSGMFHCIFSDKMFTRCEFQKWKRQMTDHQKASVYHVATTGVRFRILKNISKYFEVFLQSLKHHKMTILQNRQDLQMFPINIVAVWKYTLCYRPNPDRRPKDSIPFCRKYAQKSFLQNQTKFLTIFCLIYKEIIWTWWWVGWGLLCKSRWKCQKVQLPLGLLKFLLKC